MRTKFFINLVAILVIATSCKNEKKADDQAGANPVKQNFSVELDVVVAKKDDFTLYYTEDNTVNFVGGMAAWKGVNGGGVEEKVLFELSEEIIPTDIRLDFGLNKQQEYVQINNVNINYYGKDFTFKGSDFFNWFIKDDKFKNEIDPAKGTIKFVKSGADYVTPYFYPRQELIDQLKKLTAAK